MESEYSSQLIEKSFLKAFESGLRDENLVTNLRPFLRTSGISDDELMKNVNELATKQAKQKNQDRFCERAQQNSEGASSFD